MSRIEKFETETDMVVEKIDEDDEFLALWVKAGYWAQNATILGLMLFLVGILMAHL